MPFTETFGGTNIYPSYTSYLALSISADTTLQWPIEQAIGGNNIVADIIDLDASAPGLSVTIPDARQVSTGFTALFNNVGAETVTIRDSVGNVIISLVSGSAWQIYLRDNSTAAGSWRSFQYGASVSVANAAALAGAGLKAIATTLNQALTVNSTNATPVNVTSADRAEVFMWTGGVGVLNLPDPATVGADWFIYVRNSGSGNITVTPALGQIDAASTKVYGPGTSSMIVSDGANYYSIGYGSSTGGSTFDYTSINVAGTGNFTLSGSQLNRIAYNFTGLLTGDRTIIVPNTIQQYWVTNNTTGAFRLFVKTVTQVVPIEILQGDSGITYCNGNDVVDAESSTVTFPIVVAQGGTGANNAATARTNLAVPGLATANTYTTSPQMLSAADVAWVLNETDAAANNRRWHMRANGEQLLLQAVDDAGTGFGSIMVVDRTANTIDLIAFTATSVTMSGTLAVTGQITQNAGLKVGYLGAPQNSQSGNYTLVIGDAGKDIHHPNGAGAGDTFTIPANASVAFDVGTCVLFTNMDPNALTIAITSDTLRWAGVGSTGSRSLSQYGWAMARKTAATEWLIMGIGLS